MRIEITTLLTLSALVTATCGGDSQPSAGDTHSAPDTVELDIDVDGDEDTRPPVVADTAETDSVPVDSVEPVDTAEVTPTQVALSGAVAKGPFVIGSTVDVAPVDGAGNPSGAVYSTQTTNDLGEFSVQVPAVGLASLEGDGFYYNEATGALSSASLTLRAFAEIGGSADQAAYINIVTHLTYNRVKKLLQDGESFASARAQAEDELRDAIGVGSAGDDPGLPGVAMNLLGGDTYANAYLFAVSAVVSQAAKVRFDASGGSVDAHLQELLNQISLDLSDDGALQPNRTDELETAHREVDTWNVKRLLAARLAELGSEAPVPDIDRVIDSDGDGTPNLTDTCPLRANPGQEPMGGVCSVRIDDVAGSLGGGLIALFASDLDGDGAIDVLALQPPEGDELKVVHGEFDASSPLTLGAAQALSLDGAQLILGAFLSGWSPADPIHFVDHDGDGVRDVLLMVGGLNGRAPRAIEVDASGVATLTAPSVPLFNSWSATDAVFVDLNGDGLPDVVEVTPTFDSGTRRSELNIIWTEATGWFGRAAVALPNEDEPIMIAKLLLADLDGDGDLDIQIFRAKTAASVSGEATDVVVVENRGASGDPTVHGPFGIGVGAQGALLQAASVGDFDGDGTQDILITTVVGSNERELTIGVLQGQGDGVFGEVAEAGAVSDTMPSPVAFWNMQAPAVVTGDFDGDGVVDAIALARSADAQSLAIYVGGPSGLQAAGKVRLPADMVVDQMRAADVNGDGRADILLHGRDASGEEPVTRVMLFNP